MQDLRYKTGDKVEIVSIDGMFDYADKEDHTSLIGLSAKITSIDETDEKLPYCINDEWWVNDKNIKLK